MALATQFDRPIPGESLTGEPKNNPWESPPEMAEIADVTKFYINKLANQEVIDDFAAMCQAGAPLKPIVQSITQQGMLRGLHTVDASMLVSPIIHEFLKQAIQSMGIEVDDDGRDLQAEAEASEMNRFLLLATKYLKENPNDMEDPGKEMIQEIVEETKEEEPEKSKPKGLMARG
tara:strand:- start:423 stop:947 length:525 start_codon:yes stop_codon:yes gene_type:complete